MAMIGLGGPLAGKLLRVKLRQGARRIDGSDRQQLTCLLLNIHDGGIHSLRTAERRLRTLYHDKNFRLNMTRIGHMIARRTRSLLRQNRETVRALAEELYGRKKMSGLAITRVVNKHLPARARRNFPR
jgi:hypothetical protein